MVVVGAFADDALAFTVTVAVVVGRGGVCHVADADGGGGGDGGCGCGCSAGGAVVRDEGGCGRRGGRLGAVGRRRRGSRLGAGEWGLAELNMENLKVTGLFGTHHEASVCTRLENKEYSVFITGYTKKKIYIYICHLLAELVLVL